MMQPTRTPAGGRTRADLLQTCLSAVTIVFLLILLVVNVRQTNQFYPITSYSMFSHPTGGLNVQFELEGVTDVGQPVTPTAEDLGLTQLQLRSYLSQNVGADPERPADDAERHVGEIARAWTDRTGTSLDELTVVRAEHSVDRREPTRTAVAGWSR